MTNKMKIFAAADLHGDSKQSRKLADYAWKNKADMVILCGDISYFDTYSEGTIGPFLKKPVLFVPGNHDLSVVASIEAKYKIKDIHGSSAVINGVSFFGCGGADIGLNVLSESEIFQYLEKGFRKIKGAGKKVMVTHVHPAGTRMEITFRGSSAVRRAIEKFQPDMHICGHIHEAEGMEERIGKTRIISVGRNGKMIEI